LAFHGVPPDYAAWDGRVFWTLYGCCMYAIFSSSTRHFFILNIEYFY